MSVAATLAASASVAASAALSASQSVVGSGTAGIEAFIATGLPGAVASLLPSGVTTTAPLSSSVISVPGAFELAATFTGGLYGGLRAVRAEFDAVGVATIAIVSGLGGGMIRDVLLQSQGIYALQNPGLLLTVLLGALIAFFFAGATTRAARPMRLIDDIALGLFAVAGTDKAVLAGLSAIPVIMLGTITAVGGGLLRDLLMGKIPHILRPGTFYAAAAVMGSTLYVLLAEWLNLVKPVALVLVVGAVVLLRTLSESRGWHAPVPTDLTHVVARIPRHAVRFATRGRFQVRHQDARVDDDPSAAPSEDAGQTGDIRAKPRE